MARCMDFSKLIQKPSMIFWLNAWMTPPKHQLERPAEAEQQGAKFVTGTRCDAIVDA